MSTRNSCWKVEFSKFKNYIWMRLLSLNSLNEWSVSEEAKEEQKEFMYMQFK